MAFTIQTMFQETQKRLPRLPRGNVINYVNKMDMFPLGLILVFGLPLAAAIFIGAWALAPFIVFILCGIWGVLVAGALLTAIDEDDKNILIVGLLFPIVLATAPWVYLWYLLFPPKGLTAINAVYTNTNLGLGPKEYSYLAKHHEKELAAAIMLFSENVQRRDLLGKYSDDADMKAALGALEEERSQIIDHLTNFLTARDTEVLAQKNQARNTRDADMQDEFTRAQDIAAEIIARKKTRDILADGTDTQSQQS